jgi:hypothetical protein
MNIIRLDSEFVYEVMMSMGIGVQCMHQSLALPELPSPPEVCKLHTQPCQHPGIPQSGFPVPSGKPASLHPGKDWPEVDIYHSGCTRGQSEVENEESSPRNKSHKSPGIKPKKTCLR